MSDDERDQDIESDADKRAHHNALERKRRDHIKDSFSMLRDALPYFQGDKVRKKSVAKKMGPGKTSTKGTSRSFKRSYRNSPLVDSDDSDNEMQDKMTRREKASRAQILKKAADYIQSMRRKNTAHQQDIDDLKRQNKALEDQIRTLERAKQTGNYAAAAAVIEHALANNKVNAVAGFDEDSDSDDSSDSDESKDSPRKRLKSNSDVPLRT